MPRRSLPANIEQLPQFNTYQEDHLGFKGIIAGVADELTPMGYVPDMENLKITQEGLAAAIPNPTVIAPPTGQTALTSMFVWQRDDGSNTILAQYGAKLYKRAGTPVAWVEILKGGASAFGSTKKASYAAGMDDKLFIAQENTQCMSYDGTTLVAMWNGPKGKYITLWKNRLWVGCLTSFYGMSTTATSGGTETTVIEGGALKSAVVWSNINLAEVLHDTDAVHYDNGWSPLSMIELKTPENSICTGLLPAQETLLLFTASAVFKFSGYSEDTFVSFNSYNGSDTPKDGSVITAGGVFYISGDGFFLLSTLKTEYDTPKRISEAIKPLINLTSGVVSCANFDSRVWFLTGGTLVAINTATGAWEKYKLGGLYGTTDVGTQNIVYALNHLYIGTSTGYILIQDVPNADTVGYRSWYLITPTLNQGVTTAQKRYTSLFIYAKNTYDPIYPSYCADRGSNMAIVAVTAITPVVTGVSTGDLWGTTLWNSNWAAANLGMVVHRRLISLPLARTISFMFAGNGDGALLGYALVYKYKRKFGV